MKVCDNCERQTKKLRFGECDTCYSYRRARGVTRPAILYNRARYQPRNTDACIVCGVEQVQAKNRCSTCYNWQLTHGGKDRPEWRWNANSRCKNKNCERMVGKLSLTGLCEPCLIYHNLTNGLMMPIHLVNRARWCICGAKASHEVKLLVGMAKRRESYWLCGECYQAEFGKGA